MTLIITQLSAWKIGRGRRRAVARTVAYAAGGRRFDSRRLPDPSGPRIVRTYRACLRNWVRTSPVAALPNLWQGREFFGRLLTLGPEFRSGLTFAERTAPFHSPSSSHRSAVRSNYGREFHNLCTAMATCRLF